MGMGLRLNLSLMMFLEFAIWGAWFVVFVPYLKKLGFDGAQAGALFGNMALGAIFSPMLVGLIADRYFASQRLMALLQFAGAALLYWMAQIHNPDQYWLFYVVSLAYALVYNPTLALANSITFTHVPDATRDFPSIRVLGTIGWIAAGIFVGKALDTLSNQPLIMAAGLSVLLGALSLALPHTPPTGRAGDPLPFARALSLFKDSSFAVFFVVSGLITIVLAFYYSFTSDFLFERVNVTEIPSWQHFFFTKVNEQNATVVDAASMMTIGQIVEILFMLLLPWCLWRMGMKWVLAAGMLAWGIRYALFAVGGPFELLLLGVALHGICFDFFFAAGFIHVDNTAPRGIRGSAQALFALLTYGVGMWLGSVLSGILNKYYTTEEVGAGGHIEKIVDWRSFWTVPSIGVLAAVAVFIVFFRLRPGPPEQADLAQVAEGLGPVEPPDPVHGLS
jgi:nucleoside transporter